MKLAKITGMGAIAMMSMIGMPVLADTDAALSRYWEITNQNMPPALNAEALSDLYAEDGVMLHPFAEFPDGPLKGRDAIVGFLSGMDQKFAEWTHVETRRYIDGDTAIWEGFGRGIAKTTGKTVEVPMVFTLTFDDDGRVLEDRVYFRLETLQEQLR